MSSRGGPPGRSVSGRDGAPAGVAAAPPPPLAACVAELEALFTRFTALSEAGLRACGSGDDAALAAALDARDLVSARAESLVQAVAAARRAAGSKGARDAFDLALRPAQVAAAAAAVANAELERQAHAARTILGEQLDRLRHDDAARSAYTAAAGRGEPARLDLTR